MTPAPFSLEKFRYPHLIQRVRRRAGSTSPNSRGVDQLFVFDFMGSAEFEFGALPSALKQMRSGRRELKEIVIDDKRIYFIGHPSMLELATALFADQLKPRGERIGSTKERSCIRETYENKDVYDGWWVLDAEIPFILFKIQEHAADWIPHGEDDLDARKASVTP